MALEIIKIMYEHPVATFFFLLALGNILPTIIWKKVHRGKEKE